MAKLCIALDTDIDTAESILESLRGFPLIFKVGYKLFISHHRRITDKVKDLGFELFLDLKLHDIPNTMKNGVISAQSLGADYLTIHLMSGRKSIREAVEVKKKVKLLGVTVLTSMTQEDLDQVGIKVSLEDEVLALAKLGIQEGIDGVVCSGHEVSTLKASLGKEFLAVVPGIRLTGDASNDQRRVVTPQEAIKNGADILVMGRSITESDNPVKAVERVYNLIEKGD